MRFLLSSDTHGRPAVIDEPADRVRADALIHAGEAAVVKSVGDAHPSLVRGFAAPALGCSIGDTDTA